MLSVLSFLSSKINAVLGQVEVKLQGYMTSINSYKHVALSFDFLGPWFLSIFSNGNFTSSTMEISHFGRICALTCIEPPARCS